MIKTNTKEKELSLNDLFNFMSKRFDANDEKFDTKFDQLSNDIKEQKIKCEQRNIKNDINFKELKEQNIKFEQSISVKFDDLSNALCKRCLLYTSRCV